MNRAFTRPISRSATARAFAQFGSNVGANTFLIPTTTAPLPPTSTGTYLNRSVIYYKGVTYFGSCTGTSDLVNRIITGITNGSSDVTSVTTTTTTGAVSLGTDMVSNGQLNFTCNTSWTAKVTSTKPVLKFKGKGQLTVLESKSFERFCRRFDGYRAIPGAAMTSMYPGAAMAIATSPLERSLMPIKHCYQHDYWPAIANIPRLSVAESTLRNADIVPLTVYGIRKFFSTAGVTNGLATVRR